MSKRKAAKHRTAKPINQLPDIHITPTLEIDRPLIETLPEELIKLFAQESSEKKNPSSKYSIVTAVYNVELYLTAFFESITKQSIDFESSIEIILVDDGSIDKSSQIIQTWASRYPRNIRYLWQENAGQAKARNVGLRYAKHDWVTFIDPDDFVALDYFEKVDDSIRAANLDKKPIKMVSANLCFYLEDRNEFSDAHPLRYRFAKGNCIFPASNPNKHIQLSASTAFFKRIRILEKNLTFNEEIKPAFEDGHFVNRYLLDLEDAPIAFLSSAIYYYRKRENGSSTLDTAWEKPGRFNVQLRLGYLDLIKQSLNR
jgi:glycosyltransferase involved in cell wall biosynthesis